MYGRCVVHNGVCWLSHTFDFLSVYALPDVAHAHEAGECILKLS